MKAEWIFSDKKKSEILHFTNPHWKNDEWKYVSKKQKRTKEKVIDEIKQ